MATTLNTNFGISAPNPIDDRYNSARLSSGRQLPYSGTSEVISTIPESRRYPGLTVLIDSGATAVEYWFREGVADVDLIPKTVDIDIPSGDFITGGTNVGYFCGYSGIQVLPIDNLANNNYDGNYCSLYNYYYRDADAVIRTGAPNGCIERRGYYNPVLDKSWIWNNRINGSELVGWIFVDGNVQNLLGTCPSVATYYPPSAPYSATTWNTGSLYNNGSNAVVNTVVGSLSTGATLCIGGRPFACSEHNNLHFRTVISETPNLISVRDDESFIRISGKTSVLTASNVGAGAEVLSGQTATELYFRRIQGSGATVVTTVGDSIVIASTLTGGTGGGTYNLATPATVTIGGITAGMQLTGCTAFQLFEKMLVVYQAPTFSSFSSGIASPVEVGCTISGSQSFSWAFTNASNVSGNTMCVDDITSGVTLAANISTSSPQSISIATKTFSSCGETQVWRGCARNTCGTLFGTSQTICALLPFYWGICTCPGAPGANRPVGTSAMVLSGTKVLASSSGDITINFNSTVNDYLWFAVPSSVSDKTCWCCNSSIYGAIGGAVSPGGNLFPAPDYTNVSVTSTCSTANYDIYISNKQSAAATLKMGYA